MPPRWLIALLVFGVAATSAGAAAVWLAAIGYWGPWWLTLTIPAFLAGLAVLLWSDRAWRRW